jgi:hypothetical protein
MMGRAKPALATEALTELKNGAGNLRLKTFLGPGLVIFSK